MENTKDTTKRPSKWCSAKLWITIWAMFMVTFIVVADRSNYTSVLPMLAGVPIAYIGANVMQKKIYSDANSGVNKEEVQ